MITGWSSSKPNWHEFWIGARTICRVIKKGPKEYVALPLGFGRKTSEHETLREAKEAALQEALDYATYVKVTLEAYRDHRR